MVKGGKVGQKSNFKKKVRSRDEGSDDSDEDYVVSEEGNEESDDDAEDYCSSLDECASEEGFGSFVNEEDEEEEEKEVRKVVSSAREKEIVDRKSRKWKSVLDEEEEDEDYEGEEEEEEEEEKEVRKVVRLNAKQMSSARDGETVGRKSRRRKSVLDEDEDYEVEEEEEEEEKEVRKVVRLKAKQMSSARDGKTVGRKSRKRKSVLDEDEDYEVEEEEEEEEEKEVRKVVRLKAKQMSSAREGETLDRKSRKRKSILDEDEDYEVDEEEEEEEEEEDDAEFTLDEEDCLDEEEELTMKKKKNNLKVSKQGLRKKGPPQHRKKKKKSSVSKKPLRKRGRKKHGLKRKRAAEEEEDDDCDFIENTPIVRKRSRTNAGRQKKAYVVPSDSDFVSSGSSDYDYTISEEEREKVKEAGQLYESLKTNLRNSSSSKRIQEFEELGLYKKPPERKGKEKIEEPKAEVIKQVCGICLSEEDKRRLRGSLNCCSHYFCFTCIMEWSKVESRCPLCKQRFETISKHARSTAGVDSREVVIQVPKRDQVYQPSEEELRSYLDPYENVICSECHQGGDDELMLLCDICDSSAHTYCVGLRREVPEGNWYCDGCRPVALGSSSSQVQDSFPDQRTINNLQNRLSPIVNVGENLDSTVGSSPRTPLTPGFMGLSSPRFPVGDILAVSPVSGVGAPTLTGRRWLHRQIQNLRSINRMNLMASRTDGISAGNMGIAFANSHIDQSRETTVQQNRTQEMGTQHQTVFEERLQDDPSSSVQSTDIFSSRLGHSRRQTVQDSPTPTFNTSVDLTLWPEYAGISSNEQILQCSNGSNAGPGSCGSPFSVRDEDKFLKAKEQLQATVRSHLKALSTNIDLDNGTFKDIATSSMHTLLAACGFEHSRNEVHIVPPPSNCTHIERVATGQASLMKGCCLTCFDSFVKDVVKRILDTRSPQWLSLGL